ncbi:MAG TPA: GNAT family N-acetyltransferase [Candidatus Limnocylindrales bacterium]|nr:GNAT family N-acetyltransferase [Candidatus Limnocylindrales bacterium]
MPAVPSITTPRFELVSMTLPFMEALRRRDLAAAEHLIGAKVPTHMPDDLEHFLEFRIADLTADQTWQPWLGRAIVLHDPRAGRRIIGSIGFHSPPDETGQVEVGYRVEPEFRRQGVATEVVRAMLEWAYRDRGIRRFRASTSPDNLASQAVLAKFGFVQTGSQMDDYDGEELVFESNDWRPSR